MFRLQSNVPATCELKYADLHNGDFGAAMKLKGRFNGANEDDVCFLSNHDSALTQLEGLGVITGTGKENEKGVSYVVKKGCRLSLLQTENGKKKNVEISLEGSAPAPGKAAAPGRAAPAQTGPAQEPPSVTWERMLRTMVACIKAAAHCWKEAEVEHGPHEVAATAHSLFIDRVKRNMLSSPAPKPITEKQVNELAALAIQLNLSESDLENEVSGVTGKESDPKKMNDQQAARLIAGLRAKVSKMIEEKRKAEEEARKREAPPVQQEYMANVHGGEYTPASDEIPF